MNSAFKSFRYGCKLSFAIGAALGLAALASAQETTAGLQGIVKDSSGGVIGGALVQVTSPALIGEKKASTDSGGFYRFDNLPPGTYSVATTATGFRSFRQDNVILEVGHVPSIDIVMAVGTVSETVEVSETPAAVDVTQSKVQTN